MKVRLISHTTPVADMAEVMESPDDIIAYCGRVSNPANQGNKDTADKLIAYLIKHKHWSPLEMVDVTFEIEVERDIARQMLRHRSFSFQEFSQRYAEITGFAEPRECRMQDKKNRQSSLPCEDRALTTWWHYAQANIIANTERVYKEALEHGIAKEVARVILPEGLTMSRLYMKGSLRSWIHYLDLRTENGTQKEHRDVAFAISTIINKVFILPKP